MTDRHRGGVGATHKTPRRVRGAKTTFLACLERSGNVTEAADVATVDRSTVYRWRDEDPAFAAAWDEAQEHVTDRLEAEAILRAGEGREEVIGVTKDGEPISTVRRSDRLLEFLLKGRRASTYRESRVLMGPDGGALKVEWVNDWRGDGKS